MLDNAKQLRELIHQYAVYYVCTSQKQAIGLFADACGIEFAVLERCYEQNRLSTFSLCLIAVSQGNLELLDTLRHETERYGRLDGCLTSDQEIHRLKEISIKRDTTYLLDDLYQEFAAWDLNKVRMQAQSFPLYSAESLRQIEQQASRHRRNSLISLVFSLLPWLGIVVTDLPSVILWASLGLTTLLLVVALYQNNQESRWVEKSKHLRFFLGLLG